MQDILNLSNVQSVVPIGELCKRVSNHLEMRPVGDNTMMDIWPAGAKSDHMPRAWTGKNVKIMSWNVLNHNLVHWMLKDTEKGQGLHTHVFANASLADKRMDAIAAKILGWLVEGYIICLQEVCREQRDKFIPLFASHSVDMNVTFMDYDSKNFNMVIYDKSMYALIDQATLIPTDPIKRDGETDYYILMTRDCQKFNLASVHLKWKSNEKFAAACIERFRTPDCLPTIICGDFNASCRFPEGANVEGDHMMIYNNPSLFFLFVDQNHQRYTHINHLANAGSKERQLDCFDHIMFMNHAELL